MAIEFPKNPTAREVLFIAGGSEHEMHSAMAQSRSRLTISIKCSCGMTIAVPNTEETTRALRNIEMFKE